MEAANDYVGQIFWRYATSGQNLKQSVLAVNATDFLRVMVELAAQTGLDQ